MKQMSPEEYAALICQFADATRPMVDLMDDTIADMRPVLTVAGIIPMLPAELRTQICAVAMQCLEYVTLSNPEPEDN